MDPTPRPTRVLVIEDHSQVREALRVLIDSADNITVVSAVDSLAEAIHHYRRTWPHIVVMDCQLGDATGLDGVRALLAEFPAANIIALTTYDHEVDEAHAMAAGARGYLAKSNVRNALIPLIRALVRPPVTGR